MSPTQRALAHCKESGWLAGIVEKWNPHARIRQDLFGCIDLIVLDGGTPLGVQVTSGANVAARVTKAIAEPRLTAWLASGARFEVWGYRKVCPVLKNGKKGKTRRWELRRVPLTQTHFAQQESATQ